MVPIASVNAPAPGDLRLRARAIYGQRMNKLEQMLDDKELPASLKLGVFDHLQRVGMGAPITKEDVAIALRGTIKAIAEVCDKDTAQKLINRLKPIWGVQ